MSETPQAGQEGGTPPKKWAGKFETPEALEEAYNNTAKVHQENVELKGKYEALTKVPEKYTLPEAVKISSKEQAILERAAKKVGLNQEYFSKMAEEFHAEENAQMQAMADRRKAIGEEKVNVLHDYVKKFYPERVQDTLFRELIKDDEAMKQAMIDRDKRLNSRAPGIEGAGAGFQEKYDGQAELLKAREAYTKNPSQKNKDRYIDMARQIGEVRFKK